MKFKVNGQEVFASTGGRPFDKNKPLYIYCAVGGRSNKAARKLIAEGFDSIYDLKGGFNKWKNLK